MCTRYVRVRNADAINTFRNDLLREQWRGVYVDDVNAAYESFLNCLLLLYGEQFPFTQNKQKGKYSKKPWITKSLQNA